MAVTVLIKNMEVVDCKYSGIYPKKFLKNVGKRSGDEYVFMGWIWHRT